MKSLKAVFVLSSVSMLGGCIVVPAGPGYYPGTPGYDQPAVQGYYQPAPQRYYPPAPAYSGPPAYYGPSLGIGIYGGRGYRGWR